MDRGDHRWSEETFSPSRCQDVAQFLRSAGPLLVSYVENDQWWHGHAGSKAQAEAAESFGLGGKEREIALRSAYSLMNLSLFAAIQHINAIATLLQADPVSAYAVTAAARPAVEIAARAWWLADPDIGATDRIRRALAERLASAIEVTRLETAADLGEGKLGAPPAISEIQLEIASLGFMCNPKSGSIGEYERPGSTSLIAAFLKEDMEKGHQTIYRLLSAVSHGMVWGLMVFFSGTMDPETRQTAATYRVTQHWLDGPACTAALGVAAALKRAIELLGWDLVALENFLREADIVFG